MPEAFESKESSGGLTFKLYRGEGAALLAFDLDEAGTDDFVGSRWRCATRVRIVGDYLPDPVRPRSFRSTEAPFPKFRWIHVPTNLPDGGRPCELQRAPRVSRPGAFTGGTHESTGPVRLSHRGTLFLDDVDSLPTKAQVALLRFLQHVTSVR